MINRKDCCRLNVLESLESFVTSLIFLDISKPLSHHSGGYWIQNKTMRNNSRYMVDSHEFLVQQFLVLYRSRTSVGLFEIWLLSNLVSNRWFAVDCSVRPRRCFNRWLQKGLVMSSLGMSCGIVVARTRNDFRTVFSYPSLFDRIIRSGVIVLWPPCDWFQ